MKYSFIKIVDKSEFCKAFVRRIILPSQEGMQTRVKIITASYIEDKYVRKSKRRKNAVVPEVRKRSNLEIVIEINVGTFAL